MDSDVAADLRTINAKVEKMNGKRFVMDQSKARRALATIEGSRGHWEARVFLPGGDKVTSPVYRTFDDAVAAAIAPHVANVRGTTWAWPTEGKVGP